MPKDLDAVSIADWTSRVRHVVEIEIRDRNKNEIVYLEGIVDIEPVTCILSDSDSFEDEPSCKENDC